MIEGRRYRQLRFLGSVISLIALCLPFYSYSYPDSQGIFVGSRVLYIIWMVIPIYSAPISIASFFYIIGIGLNLTILRPRARYVQAVGFLLLFMLTWQDMISVSVHVVQFSGGFQIGFFLSLLGVLISLSEDIAKLLQPTNLS